MAAELDLLKDLIKVVEDLQYVVGKDVENLHSIVSILKLWPDRINSIEKRLEKMENK